MTKRLIVTIIYAGISCLLGLTWSARILFAMGVVLGFVFLLMDELFLYKYYFEKHTDDQVQQLITRSALFGVIMIPLALFVITSTGSRLGEGLIMGLILNLIIEMLEYRRPKVVFQQRFLADTKIEIDQQQVNLLILGAGLFFIFCNFLLIFN